ncbi:hypothetical protein [Mycolicibacterium austroafricanum]|uniref:hypothetical protein n=1 Tax=Mycolicibacterium austroafricanum TaxID=39687 RepID=UPI001CA3085C|nr:hypothetical protein [Mycolicibacterium austroafricanum]QZT56758.1 hypothetical protein JN084_28345 [Mycolicibacterium austroafricanum]
MPDTIDNTDDATELTDTKDRVSDATPEGDTSDATPEGSDSESDDAGLSRRDIKYRERLRETEAERDQLRATVETMQRREVERLAAEHLVKPGSLWTVGVELENLLDDDGAVDPEKVRAAALDARQQHGLEDPQAARKRQPVVPLEGRGNTKGGSNTWADAFK